MSQNRSQSSFPLRKAEIAQGARIEEESLRLVEEECASYERYASFSPKEREVVKRMIHASSCFQQVIDGIHFTPAALERIARLLRDSATLITDTTMILAGLSDTYTKRYGNRAVCLVSREDVREEAKEQGVTRSHLAVKKALLEAKEGPVILVCGNAPTFLYSAVESLVTEGFQPEKVAILAFPVGFVNVTEAKEYTKEFMEHFGVEGILLRGRYGSSPLTVSALHAIYKLMGKEEL